MIPFLLFLEKIDNKQQQEISESLGFFIKNNFPCEFNDSDYFLKKVGKEYLDLSLLQMKEYWKYLASGFSWDLSFGGLIPFVSKCFYQMKKAKFAS